MRFLVLNAGSGTVAAAVFDVEPEPVRVHVAKLTHHRDPATLQVDDRDDTALDAHSRDERNATLLDAVLDGAGAIDAVCHRVVHGGALQHHAVINDDVLAAIDEATALAPLHNPPAVELIERSRRRLPDAVHIACFDTAFHVTLPDAAAVYGGPHRWWDEGLRRYGFHGISHHDAACRAAAVLGRSVEKLAMVTVHCGGGVSATAVDGGASVDTTMGLTPGEGPIMASRSGSIDPGLIIHLLRTEKLDADGLERVLMQESGLLGLSGSVGGEAELRGRRSTDTRASLAVDAYVHSLRAEVASMLPALPRLDGLVLTGDVLETDPSLRSELCHGFAFAGVEIDEARSQGWDGSDTDLAADGSSAAVVAIRADEEAAMARIGSALLTSPA